MPASDRSEPLSIAILAVRALVGLALGLGALGLLLHGRRHFEKIGVDDGYRVALAAAELAAGLLFAIPRTSRYAAVGLLMVLCWAAGLHAGVHQPAWNLYAWTAAVILLAIRPHRGSSPST